ncbi:MAG: class I SAM-dependent methyltransferase [Candidatus Marinimicrobia bacterium]|nr:class I SAM-dependent methyltransferase [Candidatus Neomarinimicrobiota bacterium]
MNSPACPLCSNPETTRYHADAAREFLHCTVCDLVFAHPDFRLSREAEFQRYQFHQNDLEDSGYRKFLHKMSAPMLERIAPHSAGLDFGSGPGPLLKLMFEEQGHSMSLYDPFYAPEQSVLDDSYDFITSTEVVEHLHKAQKELDRLWACLKPHGYLGIMTSLRLPDLDFSSWHYIMDETHVVFFAPKTMSWLANRWGASLEIIGDSVIILQKQNDILPKAGIRIPALK